MWPPSILVGRGHFEFAEARFHVDKLLLSIEEGFLPLLVHCRFIESVYRFLEFIWEPFGEFIKGLRVIIMVPSLASKSLKPRYVTIYIFSFHFDACFEYGLRMLSLQCVCKIPSEGIF
jgi:hypothetical protein